MSTSILWFMELAPKIQLGLGNLIELDIEKLVGETNAALGGEVSKIEGMDLFLLQVSAAYDQQPIGLANVYQRIPYSNPERHKQNLAGAVERGWLKQQSEGVYLPTEKSKDLYKRLVDVTSEEYRNISPLLNGNVERIAELLIPVNDAAAETNAVNHKPALDMWHKFQIDENASAVEIVEMYLGNILAYRDDCHVAAWAPYKIDGYAWEVFSFVWSGDGDGIADMLEKRSGRGYDEKDYQAAFDDLVSRGWLEQDDGKYTITEKGIGLREDAEEKTNVYFNAPWEVLNRREIEELKTLMHSLATELEEDKVLA